MRATWAPQRGERLQGATQQMTLSWTGSPLIALADEKLILLLFTINQSKMRKENMNLPCVALF